MMGNALHEKNEEIRKANLNLAVANKELEAFAYSVSHDLRAPLRNIDGFSKIILEEYESRLDDSGRHYLARIRYGTHRMSVLIDDMLKFSRVSRTELDVRKVSCNELANDVLRDFVEEIKARNVSLSVRELPDVMCDYSMMRLVLSNLVANAIKYSRKTENPKIVIGYDEERGAVFVKDNGIGFDMRYHDKIFQVFQRLHLPEEYDGTGIGLAIAKKAVDRHHGSIWAEAAPGEGASFFVSLPFADK
jgi:light-regulated signal transduction histidine kinase (bacteriophytochrome)